MLPQTRDYDTLYREFRWQVPARYNIGVDVCDRWASADPERACHSARAIRTGRRRPSASAGCRIPRTGSPMCCARTASRAATASRILLPQTPEVAAAHVAIYKLGAVALPLALLFGTEALAYRLQNSGARR